MNQTQPIGSGLAPEKQNTQENQGQTQVGAKNDIELTELQAKFDESMNQDRSRSNMEKSKEGIEGLQQVTENDNNNEKQTLLKPVITKQDSAEKEEQEFTEEELAKLRNVMSLGFKKQDTTSEMLLAQEEQNQKAMDQQNLGHSNFPLDGHPYRFKQWNKFIDYDKRSCYIFKGDNCFRYGMVWFSSWSGFDNFIIIMIFINSILLACFDYTDREAKNDWNRFLEKCGLFFTFIFTLECIIKIVAMGFVFHRNSYLRDPWNWIDFSVVCIGVIEFIPNIPNLKGLRTMRVLRPLRSVNAFPKMRRLIASLLASIPSLGNAVVFMFFIFLLFGILGVQQFGGKLYQRCRTTPDPIWDDKRMPGFKEWRWPTAELKYDRLCTLDGQGAYTCPKEFTCGSPTSKPGKFITEIADGVQNDDLIGYNIANFNNLFLAMNTIFVMITLEGWSFLMYNLSDASQSAMAVIFCVLLVVVGSFFLLNVILAVIMDAFTKNNAEDTEAIDEQKAIEQKQLMRAYGIIESDDDEKAKLAEIVADGQTEANKINQIADSSAIEKPQHSNDAQILSNEGIVNPVGDSVENDAINVAPVFSGNVGGNLDGSEVIQKGNVEEQSLEQLIKEGRDDDGLQMQPKTQGNKTAPLPLDGQENEVKSKKKSKKQKPNEEQIEIPDRAKNNRFFRFFFLISVHSVFNISMTIAIIVNTFLLALDRYPISKRDQTMLEEFNVVLTWVFIVEMVIKLNGFGIKGYLSDSFNIFDGTVVMISVFEMILEAVLGGFKAGGAVSSLRAVRLLRVFKLARSWTSFRDLLAKMIDTAFDINYFALLMFIFMFIFTLLGMELFAYKIKFVDEDKSYALKSTDKNWGEGVPPRANFNDFFQGFTTIFIVFIGEDWNSVMYDHVRGMGWISVGFFIPIFITGNLIMLNLFLAILLKNFEEPPEKEDPVPEEEKGPGLFETFKQKLCCCCPGVKNSNEIDPEDNPSETFKTPRKGGDISNSVIAENTNKQGSANDDGMISPRADGKSNKAPVRYNTDSKNIQIIEENTDDKKKENDHSLSPNKTKQMRKQHKHNHPEDGECSFHAEMDSMFKKGALSQTPNPKQFMKLKTIEQGAKSERFSISTIKQMELKQTTEPSKKKIDLVGNSLFVFKPDNCVRKSAGNFVSYKFVCNTKGCEFAWSFDYFILTLIILSTLMLTLESPLMDPTSERATNLYWIDVVVTAFFTLELVTKVLVYGFMFNGEDSYMKNSWNVMDFFIVVFSLISLAAKDVDLGVIKTFRML